MLAVAILRDSGSHPSGNVFHSQKSWRLQPKSEIFLKGFYPARIHIDTCRISLVRSFLIFGIFKIKTYGRPRRGSLIALNLALQLQIIQTIMMLFSASSSMPRLIEIRFIDRLFVVCPLSLSSCRAVAPITQL